MRLEALVGDHADVDGVDLVDDVGESTQELGELGVLAGGNVVLDDVQDVSKVGQAGKMAKYTPQRSPSR